MAKFKPKNRLELDEVLRENGQHSTLFRDGESRERAAWILKQIRMGSDRKTVRFVKP